MSESRSGAAVREDLERGYFGGRTYREVEERTVTVRRLGERDTSVQSLDAVTKDLARAATPPDLL